MIGKSDFEKIRKEMAVLESSREESIRKSRDIIKLSKQIIYSVHRNDLKEAEKLIVQIKKEMSGLPKQEAFDPGVINVAEQEYVEAAAFYSFAKDGVLPQKDSLRVNTINFLSGICDLTGEMVRKAVNSVISGSPAEALRIKEVVDELYGEFLKMDLRNSELRKKFDQIKWNLKKLEEVAYDLKKVR